MLSSIFFLPIAMGYFAEDGKIPHRTCFWIMVLANVWLLIFLIGPLTFALDYGLYWIGKAIHKTVHKDRLDLDNRPRRHRQRQYHDFSRDYDDDLV